MAWEDTKRLELVNKILKKELRPLQTIPRKVAMLYIVGIPFDSTQINYTEPFATRGEAEEFVANYQVKHGKRLFVEEFDLLALFG